MAIESVESAHQPIIARHRWTVDEYYRMAEKGILRPDARVGLIDGVVIDMPPIGAEHAACACDQPPGHDTRPDPAGAGAAPCRRSGSHQARLSAYQRTVASRP